MLIADALRHSALLRPRHPALVDGRRSVSYAELHERVARLASVLGEGLGLAPGERFALLSRNRAEIVELFFAGGLAGCPLVPLSYRLAPLEMAEIIADAEVRVVFAEAAFAEAIETVVEAGFDGRVVWIEDDGEPRDASLEGLIAAARPSRQAQVAESEIAIQYYTSGTTGKPKGVMLSHRNLLAGSWSHLAERSAVAEDRYLTTAPLCHLGAGSRMLLLVHAGATHVIDDGFDAERTVAAMRGDRANATLIVPAMMRQLIDAASDRPGSLRGKVRLITYGTAPMPVGLLTEALELFGCDFQQGYGLTEAGPNLTILPPADHRPDADGAFSPRLASVGRETIGVQVRVVDGDANDVPAGEIGEVVASGHNIMEGYWRREQETAETLRGGMLWTGDVGYLDPDGYLHLVDRSKDMLVSGGFNVYPREIERQLEDHPDVAEVAVVGISDERWGEVPLAFVVATESADRDRLEQELDAFVQPRLARFKQPKRYELLGELPRNQAGKVMKHRLRERAAAAAGTSQADHGRDS